VRSRYLFPGIAFGLVWLPGSFTSAYRFGSRMRLTGPGHDAITPIIDAWTQTAQAWLAPAFFAGVTVFVFERWLEDRRAARAARANNSAN
jgi:hypothetical protein